MGTTIKAMLNTDRQTASGLYPLVIRVIHNRRKKMIYLGFKVRITDFDPVSEFLLWREGSLYEKRRIKEINRLILLQKRSLSQAVSRLFNRHGDEFTLDVLFAQAARCKSDRYFFVYAANEIRLKRSSNKFGTAGLYQSTVNSLKRFHPQDDLPFREITYRFLSHYICFLEQSGVSANTIHMYLRNLRSIYNKAHKEGGRIGRDNPFSEIKMGVLPTVKRALPKETIRAIAALDFTADSRLDMARDLFLFSFYTRGMSFVDIALLKKSNIVNHTICYSRNKTHQHMQVGITLPLQRLLDKYRNESAFVLPLIESTDSESAYREYRKLLYRVNLSLKEIGKMLNIDTPLTTYVARHSWATIAKESGISITTISEGLGHSTEKTTQIYLRNFDNRIIDDVNTMIVNLCITPCP